MSDLSKPHPMTDLKAAAEAAKAATAAYIADPTDRETGRQWDRACAEFSLACTEDAILALIRERDEARKQVNDFRLSQSLDKDSAYVIRELLNRHNVPAAAFVDDHVANAIAQRDAAEAALSAAREEVERLMSVIQTVRAKGIRIEREANALQAVGASLEAKMRIKVCDEILSATLTQEPTDV